MYEERILRRASRTDHARHSGKSVQSSGDADSAPGAVEQPGRGYFRTSCPMVNAARADRHEVLKPARTSLRIHPSV
jgi:hypothetical protein